MIFTQNRYNLRGEREREREEPTRRRDGCTCSMWRPLPPSLAADAESALCSGNLILEIADRQGRRTWTAVACNGQKQLGALQN